MSGGALAAEKVGLSSPRQGLFLRVGSVGQVSWAGIPALQRLLAVVFILVFPLSQLSLRWAKVPVPIRNSGRQHTSLE